MPLNNAPGIDAVPACKNPVPQRWRRLLLVWAGIFFGQLAIYGPSLLGLSILLPLDILSAPGVYLPRTQAVAHIVPHDRMLSDLVLQFETDRRFAVSELHSGRFPFWAPYQYAGAPFVWPKYSPFLLFQCLTASPVILAWAQVLASLVAGTGAYLFFRRTLAVGFWPAAVCAWGYPLSGFLVFWQGFPTCYAVYWLPWLLLAIHSTVRRTSPWAAPGLSVVTGCVLVSGHLDVAGQVLLVSGFYGLWCWFDAYRHQWTRASARTALLLLSLGWSLGFLLAAPHIVPFLEYVKTSARMSKRADGQEDRAPGDLSTLPQIAIPDIYGATRADSFRMVSGNQIESSAAGYSGLFITLLLAPLAWCSRRHRSVLWFWAALAVFGLSWTLGIPGFLSFFRLPGLRMMSHSRLVFATSFAMFSLAAIGFDQVIGGIRSRQGWFWVPILGLVALGAWCLWQAALPPEPLASLIGDALRQNRVVPGFSNLDQLAAVQAFFFRTYSVGALLSFIAAAYWIALWSGRAWRPWMPVALGVLVMGDLLWFANDRSAQCDPALYYPRLPVLEAIARSEPGRVLGYKCLPAQLTQTHGLMDIRGYDSVDPARLMDLLELTAAPDSEGASYAMSQWFRPARLELGADGVRLSPVLDLLGVRHVIFRGQSPPRLKPAFSAPDYWVLKNPKALPRAFVPSRVVSAGGDAGTLAAMGAPGFDPRAVAYVATPVPETQGVRGKAEILRETPLEVVVSFHMDTPGMVVLADAWDAGWRAYLNGNPVPILRVDHAFRGVMVPAANGSLEFRYQSSTVALGFGFAGFSILVLAGWSLILWRSLPERVQAR